MRRRHGLSSGYGSPAPITAVFGENGVFCAIDAGGEQEIICWDKTNKTSSVPSFGYVLSMAVLSGGEGFLCGITANNSQAFCWDSLDFGTYLVPKAFRYNSYSQIAAGRTHVCAIKGPYFSSNGDSLFVDCWEFHQILGESNLTMSFVGDHYANNVSVKSIVSGDGFSCGVAKESGEVECWGDWSEFDIQPRGTRFVSLSAGGQHFCGIREDDHAVECWGRSINVSSVPKASGFLAIASSDSKTCGVREVDLILDCWGTNKQSSPDYSPPLQLCSPGVCSPRSCANGNFAFNASILNEPELTTICARNELKICLPCGTNCSEGYFPSSACSANADRICAPCSLCQNSSCWDVFGVSSEPRKQKQLEIKNEKRRQTQNSVLLLPVPPLSLTTYVGEPQVYRLSELKVATHGFKEFSELGRGSFGFVYKAVLPDGRQVAIKRANAATIIHTNSRDFETELEILCNVKHTSIVILIGYCAEMGGRLLIHSPIVHRDLKTSNILLDAEWGARIADFRILSANTSTDVSGDMGEDVYNFGIVLLEILSGRKAYDRDCTPPGILEWTLPLIRKGKAAAIIDRNIALRRNVEPLLKLADLAELSLRENPTERPSVSDLVTSLDQIVKCELILS
ncbi:putative phytol kinase 1 [Hibiscus syriacus]|uniref:non-specific serine/threonine protein kinase n=1 Tax=Hibiscus syriacus TaxID=106335 RepID=A0A6A2YRW9_HIBSY|nr:putative phytol kinase 1 [Hibiscus syriacus]